ncbi:hypothetical protein OH809_41060 [Streptomyces sp. NBC_00873]|uniref:hypothetical protein n=1 Tax=unclassified Streptomyces TaxID=2593676 RepID=UPI0038674206|nr:hypothetical protein OH809_41060 [Streptomyces sp. NBC_00873]WTA41698.1 hypothetical protein OH821_02640 [Streptomyces sp. NBC_00842]
MGQRTRRMYDQPHHASTAKISASYLPACAIESLAGACTLAEADGVRPTGLVAATTNTPPLLCATNNGAGRARRRFRRPTYHRNGQWPESPI